MEHLGAQCSNGAHPGVDAALNHSAHARPLLQALSLLLPRFLEAIQGNPPFTREEAISQALATPQLQGLLHQLPDRRSFFALTRELKDIFQLRIRNLNSYFHTCSARPSDFSEGRRP